MYRKFIQTCFNADGHLIVRNQLMKRYYREIFNWVMQQYPEYVTYNDKMKAIRQGEYRRCEQCSAIISYNKHSDYCSRKCLVQSDYFKNAVLAKLYGDEANTKRAESFKRYGKDNPLFHDRIKGTANLKGTYGENNPLAKSSESRTKRDYTIVDLHASQNETIKSRAIDKAKRTRESAKRELLDSIQFGLVATPPIGRHKKFVNEDIIRQNYVKWHHHAKAYILEYELCQFLNELNIDYITNSRKVIAPKELDIFIPKYNLAIEFNGVYWHDSFKIDKRYHADKTNACENVGIQLIHIWENDWNHKREIVKSIIRSKLGLCDRIYARECVVRYVNSHQAARFFQANHLKGNRSDSHTNFGLFHGDELVMCMSFTRLEPNSYDFELLRMASKLGITVVGGMSKLLKAFITEWNAQSIMSYVDRDSSNGSSYYACGFQLIATTKPSYWYVRKKDGVVKSRQSMAKSKLKNLHTYDENLSESDIIEASQEYWRIHNSGNLKMLKICQS